MEKLANKQNKELTLREVVLCFNYKYNGDFSKIYDALESKEVITDDMKANVDNISQFDLDNAIALIDKEYPEFLKEVSMPPFTVWVSKITDNEIDYSSVELHKVQKSTNGRVYYVVDSEGNRAVLFESPDDYFKANDALKERLNVA